MKIVSVFFILMAMTGGIVNSSGNKIPEVIITIDDAYETVLEYAFPVIEKFGFKATLYVPTNYVGMPEFLDYPELRFLQNEGWEIGGHGHNHVSLTNVPLKTAEMDIQSCYNHLTDEGFSPMSFAFPSTQRNAMLDEIVKKYFTNIRLKDYLSFGEKTRFDHFLDYFERRQKLNQPVILVFHNIVPENLVAESRKITCSTKFLEDVLNYLHENDIIPITYYEYASRKSEEEDISYGGCFPF